MIPARKVKQLAALSGVPVTTTRGRGFYYPSVRELREFVRLWKEEEKRMECAEREAACQKRFNECEQCQEIGSTCTSCQLADMGR